MVDAMADGKTENIMLNYRSRRKTCQREQPMRSSYLIGDTERGLQQMASDMHLKKRKRGAEAEDAPNGEVNTLNLII